MRRAFAISSAFALVALVAAACDEFAEGSSPADADAAADASADAPSSDSSSSGDAAADASASAFCRTVDATFCWSFDDDSNGSALYGPSFAPRGRPVTLTDAARSLPNALHAEGSGDSGYAAVETIVTAQKRIACTAAVWFEEITNLVEVVTFDVGADNIAFQVQPLDAKAVRAFLLYDRTGPKLVTGLPNLPMKAWIEVTLAGERTESGVVISASALGTKIEFPVPDAGALSFDSLAAQFGFYAQYGGRGAVRVDDVYCSYE